MKNIKGGERKYEKYFNGFFKAPCKVYRDSLADMSDATVGIR